MSPVFGHGQLRLYLLASLSEGPRHGYDLIQDLEQQFDGWYTPSPGTIYPRLAKLEEEGLVERTDEGRKATYRLTDAGRAHLDARRSEVADLRADLERAVGRVADEVRARVHGGAAGLRDELQRAARDARASASPRPHDAPPTATAGRHRAGPSALAELERGIDTLRRVAGEGWRGAAPSPDQVDEIGQIIADAAKAISDVLRRR